MHDLHGGQTKESDVWARNRAVYRRPEVSASVSAQRDLTLAPDEAERLAKEIRKAWSHANTLFLAGERAAR